MIRTQIRFSNNWVQILGDNIRKRCDSKLHITSSSSDIKGRLVIPFDTKLLYKPSENLIMITTDEEVTAVLLRR